MTSLFYIYVYAYTYLNTQEKSDIYTIVFKAIKRLKFELYWGTPILIFTYKFKAIETKNVSLLLISFNPILRAYAVS